MPVRFQNNFAPRTQLGSQLGAAINALFGNIPTAYERELNEARIRNLNADSDLKVWQERMERLRHNVSSPEGLMETALHGVGGTQATGDAYQDRYYGRTPAAPPAVPGAAPMPAPTAAPAVAPAGQLLSPPPQKLWAPTDSYIAPPDVQVQPLGMEALDFGMPLEGPAERYGPPIPPDGSELSYEGVNGPNLPSGWLPPSLLEQASGGMLPAPAAPPAGSMYDDPALQDAARRAEGDLEERARLRAAASIATPAEQQRLDNERLLAESATGAPTIPDLMSREDPPFEDGRYLAEESGAMPGSPRREAQETATDYGTVETPPVAIALEPGLGDPTGFPSWVTASSPDQTRLLPWDGAGRSAEQDFKEPDGKLPEKTSPQSQGESYWTRPPDEPVRTDTAQDFRGATHMPDAAATSGKSASQIAQEAVRAADPSLSDEMSRRLGAMIAALRMGVTTQTTDPRNITSAYTTLQGGPVREGVLAGRMTPGEGGARLAAAEGKKLHSNFAGGSMNDYTGALNAEPSWVAENRAKADNQTSQAGLNKERVNTEKSRQKLMGAQTRYNDQRYRGGPRAGGAAAADDKPMPASEVNAMNKVFAQALEQIEGEQGGKIPAEVKASIMSHAAHLYQTQFRGDTFGAIQEALATLAPEWSQEHGWNPFSDDDDRIVPRGGSGGAARKPVAPAASAPAKPAAAVPPRPAGLSDEQIRAQAKQAIDGGADVNEVNARLRAWGVKG